MLLMIDNYDSFTFNLVQYLGELGEDRDAPPEPGVLVHGHACYRSLKGQHSTLLRLWYMYRTLCQLQLAPRQDVCVSCPSLSTAYPRLAHLLHASASLAELCVTAMLLHCQGAARGSSCLFQKEPPSACAFALLACCWTI